MQRIQLENKEIFKGIVPAGYEVTCFDKYLNVIESVRVENLKEARRFMKLFFQCYTAYSIVISKVVEVWYLDEVKNKWAEKSTTG